MYTLTLLLRMLPRVWERSVRFLFLIAIVFQFQYGYGIKPAEPTWKKDYRSLKQYEDIFIGKKVYRFCNQYETWLLDAKGRKISRSYRDIGKFYNGLAEFVPHEPYEGLTGNHGFLNKQGQVVIPPIYHSVGAFFSDTTWAIKVSDSSYYSLHFINAKGEIVYSTPMEAFKKSFLTTKAGFAVACHKDTDETLYWNAGGSGGLMLLFSKLSENNVARTKVSEIPVVINYNGWFGYINKQRFLTTPAVLEEVDLAGRFSGYGLQRVRYRNLFGFVNVETGELALNCEFEDTKKPYAGLFWVKKNGKWGAITASGLTKIDFKFEDVREFSANGRSAVKYKGGCGHIDTTGQFTTEPLYTKVSSFSEGLAIVYKDELFGYVNSDGEFDIPLQFSSATPFINGSAIVTRLGVIFEMNKNKEMRVTGIRSYLLLPLLLLFLLSLSIYLVYSRVRV